MRLGIRLGTFVEAHKLGVVTGADGTYDLSPPGTPPTKGTGLVPDVAFIRAERLPPHVSFDEDKAVPFAPDLAVAVASPSQYTSGMAQKAQRYLAAGTRLVWIVWPKRRQIDVWRSADTKPSQTLDGGDTLDGDVLPGFTCPVAELFA
jgi:Uma2 family endonuclease